MKLPNDIIPWKLRQNFDYTRSYPDAIMYSSTCGDREYRCYMRCNESHTYITNYWIYKEETHGAECIIDTITLMPIENISKLLRRIHHELLIFEI